MVIKVFVSRVSGSMKMKKDQDFILNLLAGRHIEHEEIDISDPSKEEQKQFMRENAVPKEGQRFPLPPQVFNEDVYCGDFDAFHEANECDELFEFLKMAPEKNVSEAAITLTDKPGEDTDEEELRRRGDPTLNPLTGNIQEDDDDLDNRYSEETNERIEIESKRIDDDEVEEKKDFGSDDDNTGGVGTTGDDAQVSDGGDDAGGDDDDGGNDDQGEEEAVNGDDN